MFHRAQKHTQKYHPGNRTVFIVLHYSIFCVGLDSETGLIVVEFGFSFCFVILQLSLTCRFLQSYFIIFTPEPIFPVLSLSKEQVEQKFYGVTRVTTLRGEAYVTMLGSITPSYLQHRTVSIGLIFRKVFFIFEKN